MSIFSLASEPNSQADGVSGLRYERVQSVSAINDGNFANNQMVFRFNPSGNTWWLPSRSYFRLRCKLTDQSGDALNTNNAIVPSMGLANNLFSNCRFDLGDTQISTVSSDVGRVAAYLTRTTKSRAWLEGPGNSLNCWSSDKGARRLKFSNKEAELVFNPPLSICQYEGAIPGGKMSFHLQGDSNFKLKAVEATVAAAPGAQYLFEVVSLEYYACLVNGPDASDRKYVLDLTHISCITRDFQGSQGQSSQTFDINPATTEIGLALTQNDNTAAFPPSLFRSLNQNELKLTSYFFSFDNRDFPTPQSDQSVTIDVNERIAQRWYDTQLNTGMAFVSGGSESLTEWLLRGAMYVWHVPRTASSNATRLQFTYIAPDAQAILLFTKHQRSYLVRVSDSRVIAVETSQNS